MVSIILGIKVLVHRDDYAWIQMTINGQVIDLTIYTVCTNGYYTTTTGPATTNLYDVSLKV